MFEKIWDRHVIVMRGENEALLHVDRNFVHEGSFHAFGALAARPQGAQTPPDVRDSRPLCADPQPRTGNRRAHRSEMRNMLELFAQNTRANGIANYYGLDHPQQGIVHVVGPSSASPSRARHHVRRLHTSTHGHSARWRLASAPRN